MLKSKNNDQIYYEKMQKTQRDKKTENQKGFFDLNEEYDYSDYLISTIKYVKENLLERPYNKECCVNMIKQETKFPVIKTKPVLKYATMKDFYKVKENEVHKSRLNLQHRIFKQQNLKSKIRVDQIREQQLKQEFEKNSS